MDWVGDLWDFLFALNSGAWAATAAWVAVAIGLVTIVVTGKYAKRQIRQAQEQLTQGETARLEQAEDAERARQESETARLAQAEQAEAARQQQAGDAQALREEQARPYVVAFMEPNSSHWGFVDLVIKNFGRTAAYEINIEFTPDLEVAPFDNLNTGERVTHLSYPKKIPMLAPAQDWQTSWDYIRRRNKSEVTLADRHEAHITYRDINGKSYDSPATLDWNILNSKMTVTTLTFHDFAKHFERDMKSQNSVLADIRQALQCVLGEHTGIWVYPVDPEKEKQYRSEQARIREEESEENRRFFDSMFSTSAGETSVGDPETKAAPEIEGAESGDDDEPEIG